MHVLASLYTVRAYVCTQFVGAIILIMREIMNWYDCEQMADSPSFWETRQIYHLDGNLALDLIEVQTIFLT